MPYQASNATIDVDLISLANQGKIVITMKEKGKFSDDDFFLFHHSDFSNTPREGYKVIDAETYFILLILMSGGIVKDDTNAPREQ